MSAQVHAISAPVEDDYRRERQQIREMYGDSRQQAGAHYDQALAALFTRYKARNLTQEWLAREEGKSHDWVSLHLEFGAFLAFSTMVENAEWSPVQARLTERKFREYAKRAAFLMNVAYIAAARCGEAHRQAGSRGRGVVSAGGIDYEDNAPSTVLDAWLKSAKEGDTDKLLPGNYYQGCIYAWNAYREGKNIKDVRYAVAKGLLQPHAD